ncbi:unnamed protein product [Rotaria sp. Silwood2]|nr:unnamed protein product [Rotaria sp. Silwood2]
MKFQNMNHYREMLPSPTSMASYQNEHHGDNSSSMSQPSLCEAERPHRSTAPYEIMTSHSSGPAKGLQVLRSLPHSMWQHLQHISIPIQNLDPGEQAGAANYDTNIDYDEQQ